MGGNSPFVGALLSYSITATHKNLTRGESELSVGDEFNLAHVPTDMKARNEEEALKAWVEEAVWFTVMS